MQNTTICGLDRTAMAEAGAPRSFRTLDEVKADAKESGKAQVIAHRTTARILIVLPGGAVWGTTSMWFHDEALSVAETLPCGYVNRIGEEVG